MRDDVLALSQEYKGALLEDVLRFWQRYSVDKECGGYFTCLDRDGTVYDTDKFMWLQAREVWMFSALYNRVEPREDWLQLATHGVDFLRKYGQGAEGNWYFSLNRQGEPLVQPYNIFSDCFAAMALCQYALATGEDAVRQLAVDTYHNILRRQDNPKGPYNKAYPGTRNMTGLALPMILANLTLELEAVLEPEVLKQTLDHSIDAVMNTFLDKDHNIIYENAAPDGTKLDNFDGRLINPGHGIETMWFLMDIGERRQDKHLIEQCTDIALSLIEYGWDKAYDGIFYFMDAQGHPPQQLEWDRKLWWVHLEALVAMLKGYRLTGRPACWDWFERLHEYSWNHFADPEYGEWFGYLDRQGQPFLSLKGGKWKGCFHVPRGLWICWQELEALAALSR